MRFNACMNMPQVNSGSVEYRFRSNGNKIWFKFSESKEQSIPDGLGVRIPDSHSGGPGSIPGQGAFFHLPNVGFRLRGPTFGRKVESIQRLYGNQCPDSPMF